MMDDHTVVERLTTLAVSLRNVERMLTDLRETLDGRLQEHDGRLTKLEEQSHRAALSAVQACNDTAAALRRVGELEPRVEALEKLSPVMRAALWVGVVLGMSILALIWALITGQAQVVFQ